MRYITTLLCLMLVSLLTACDSGPEDEPAQASTQGESELAADTLEGIWLRPVRIEGEQEGWEGFVLHSDGELELVGIYSMAADEWSTDGKVLTLGDGTGTQAYQLSTGSDTLTLSGEGYLAGSYERSQSRPESYPATSVEKSVGPQLSIQVSYPQSEAARGTMLVVQMNSPQHAEPLITLRQKFDPSQVKLVLPYDANLIHEDHAYSVSGTLENADGETLARSQTVSVITHGGKEEIVLDLSHKSEPETG